MVGILGANSVSGGYEISNSLRFNNDDSPRLTFTPSSAGNRRTFTLSVWFKLGDTVTTGERVLLAADDGTGNNGNFDYIAVNGTDRIFVYGYTGSENQQVMTAGLLRDPSAWYHLVFAYDTTQSTAADRVKIYLNGSRVTDIATGNYPSLNLQSKWNNNNAQRISSYPDQDTSYFDGYMAEYHLVDGTAKAPSDFGEFDDNGVWIPKAYTGAYGTNGFYLEFKETGTSQNSSGIGADTSGNDNHWAVTNLAATDVTTDTPTNNFCTMNPLHSEGMTFSEGNLDILAATTNWNIALGTIAIPNSGKWYMEAKITVVQAAGHNAVGFLDSNYPFGSNDTATGFTGGGGSWLTYIYFHAANDNAYVNNADGTAYQLENNTTFNAGVNDILMMAFDRDNDKVWFGLNDAWAKANGTTGANPSTGADATIVSVQENSARTYMPMMAAGNSSARQQWNFGNAPYAISSGNADANGYGNFEYAVPTGFYSLCTKNLAEFG